MRAFWVLFFVIIAGGAAGSARAWGPVGHAVIADVASAHIRPRTRAAVKQLLRHSTMAGVSSWADVVREERPQTANWHFVDIENENDDYVAARDCAPSDRGDCAIAAIERFRKVLADRTAPAAARAEALRFIIHLVGDIHQPMHSADHHDHGGNETQVAYCGQGSNLHRVRDSDMIQATGLTEEQYRAHIEGFVDALADAEVAHIQAGDPIAWVLEAHKAAVTRAYKIPANPGTKQDLCGDYTHRNLALVDQQLARGALRLAKILDDALGK